MSGREVLRDCRELPEFKDPSARQAQLEPLDPQGTMALMEVKACLEPMVLRAYLVLQVPPVQLDPQVPPVQPA
jgi:hypothetical protein